MHESPRRGLRATGTGPHHHREPPLTDDEIRALGFERTHRGWVPVTDEAAERIAAADSRRHYEDTASFRIPGDQVACTVCDEPASPSTVGMPVCGGICSAVLMHELLAKIGNALYSKADGSGGTPTVRPITPPPSSKRFSVAPRGSVSVDRALERLGTVAPSWGATVSTCGGAARLGVRSTTTSTRR
jgi:hypothetical protein